MSRLSVTVYAGFPVDQEPSDAPENAFTVRTPNGQLFLTSHDMSVDPDVTDWKMDPVEQVVYHDRMIGDKEMRLIWVWPHSVYHKWANWGLKHDLGEFWWMQRTARDGRGTRTDPVKFPFLGVMKCV